VEDVHAPEYAGVAESARRLIRAWHDGTLAVALPAELDRVGSDPDVAAFRAANLIGMLAGYAACAASRTSGGLDELERVFPAWAAEHAVGPADAATG
jgi:hypothetical protein